MKRLLAVIALALLCGCNSNTKKEKPASLTTQPEIHKTETKNPRFNREDSYQYDNYMPKNSSGFYNPFAKRLF